MTKINKFNNEFYSKISEILKFARNKVIQTVNTTMVETYFEIGRLIIEEEQSGSERAEYGKQILKELSSKLTSEFGLGFSVTNLQQMKNFYNIYGKQQTVSAKSNPNELPCFKLSWSHYLKLMRIEDELERKFYEIECAKNNWSLRELQRQYDSALYTRLALSRNKITGIKYKVSLANELKQFDIEHFDINEVPATCLLTSNKNPFSEF